MQYVGAVSKMTEWMIYVHFQDKPLNITVIQVYDPITNDKKAKVERFHKDLQDILELKPPKMYFSS